MNTDIYMTRWNWDHAKRSAFVSVPLLFCMALMGCTWLSEEIDTGIAGSEQGPSRRGRGPASTC